MEELCPSYSARIKYQYPSLGGLTLLSLLSATLPTSKHAGVPGCLPRWFHVCKRQALPPLT